MVAHGETNEKTAVMEREKKEKSFAGSSSLERRTSVALGAVAVGSGLKQILQAAVSGAH